MKEQQHDISPEELRKRVLYSLLLPAVRLARLVRIPLKDLTGLVAIIYFEELRTQGLTLKESAEALGMSQRTAVRLSKELREPFFLPEVTHNLQRHLEFMLATRPMGFARLRQVLPQTNGDKIEEALQSLLEQGRIRELNGRTKLYTGSNIGTRRLVGDSWISRVGALNSLMGNLFNATYGRLLRNEPRAFVRTLSFNAPPGVVEQLHRFYENVIRREVENMDKQAEQNESDELMQLSLCWAPYEYLNDKEDQKGK